MNQFSLYSYYRSSCSYRVRIALAHKNISYNYIPVHLVQNGGEQFSKAYSEINPKNEVPTLIHGKNSLSQSMAIFNYLDAVVPENLLFPSEKYKRAKVIEFCEIINSGIQPLQNLGATKTLSDKFNLTSSQLKDWSTHWIIKGFEALESNLKKTAGTFCFGGEVTAADMFLVPQVYNAKRNEISLTSFPLIERICKRAEELESFEAAHPSRQIDAPRE